jgi:uridine kinase
VDTDDDIRLIRRMERDVVERGRSVESIISQYLQTVRPMHLQYVQPSKKNADIIVPQGLNSVALDLVISKLKRVLADAEELKTPISVRGNSIKPQFFESVKEEVEEELDLPVNSQGEV